MKKIILILFLTLYTFANAKCIFKVYYIPLSIDTYLPLLRKDILSSDISFNMSSETIPNLFQIVLNLKFNSFNWSGMGSSLKEFNHLDGTILNLEKFDSLRGEEHLIRIMLVDKNNNELFITQKKQIISLSKREIYPINILIVNEILDKFKQHIKLHHRNSINFPYVW